MAEYLGLQIKANSIEAARLSEEGSGVRLVDCFTLNFSDDKSLADALRDCANRFDESGDMEWCVGLPAEEFSLRHLSFPFQKKRAIESALPFELETLLPYAIETLETSAWIMSPGAETKVLACAAQKERLDFYRNALNQAGISATAIIPDVVALYYLHERFFSQDTPSIIVSAERERIAACYKTSENLFDFHVAETGATEMEIFKASISSSGFPEPEIYIVGGKTGYLAAPPDTKEPPGWKAKLKSSLNTYLAPEENMIPIGLALRAAEPPNEGFNFSLDTGISFSLGGSLRLKAFGAVLALIIWLGFILAGNHIKSSEINENKTLIKNEFLELFPGSKVVKPVYQMSQKLERIEKRLKSAGMLDGQRSDFLWLLKEISEKTPDDKTVAINEMNYGERGLSITGDAKSFNDVEKLKTRLGEIALFEGIDIVESKASGNDGSIAFKLRVRL